jgi:hypothetical protein
VNFTTEHKKKNASEKGDQSGEGNYDQLDLRDTTEQRRMNAPHQHFIGKAEDGHEGIHALQQEDGKEKITGGHKRWMNMDAKERERRRRR